MALFTIPFFYSCLIMLVVLTGCEKPKTETAAPMEKKQAVEGKIIAVGDSLTAGYGIAEEQAFPALLEEKLRPDGYNFQVINAGISGETSSGALSRIPWILAQEPDIVILETGANDALRGVPTNLTRRNITNCVRLLKEKNVVVILAGMQIVRNLGVSYTKSFAEMYPAVAKEENVLLIPFFLEGVAENPSLNQADFIHPNEEGHRIIVNSVYPFVLEAIKELRK